VNGTTDNVLVAGNGFTNLTFNSDVDSQQEPMVMYAIDWGDNETTAVAGVEMRDRPNADNPHSLYHLYNYWDLKAKNSVDQTMDDKENTVYCGNSGEEVCDYDGLNTAGDLCGTDAGTGYECSGDSDCCVVRPGIVIKDNWGWCSNGAAIDDCGNWEYFVGWIEVAEK